MATLTVQDIVRTGLETTYADAAGGGDDFANTGVEFIHIKNGSGSDITLTIVTTETIDGLAVADRTVVITAGEERMIGPFPCRWYGASVSLTYSDVTSLTLAIIKPDGN